MALPDVPLPPELALEAPPFTDDYLDAFLEDADTIRESAPDAAAVVDRWRVESDDEAEWALRRMALAQEELRRLAEQSEEWERRIRHWFVHTAARHERTRRFMEERLEDYALRLREAGAAPTLQLPSGTIKTTERRPAVEVADDDVLASYIDRSAMRPPPDASEEALHRFHAWVKALAAVEEEEAVLVKRSPKVYVGPLRKIVRVGDVPDGVGVHVLLACGHVQEWQTETEDDLGIPTRGEIYACLECPADSIEGAAMVPVQLVTMKLLRRPAAIGPDGEEVPGASVKPGGIVPKVEAR